MYLYLINILCKYILYKYTLHKICYIMCIYKYV